MAEMESPPRLRKLASNPLSVRASSPNTLSTSLALLTLRISSLLSPRPRRFSKRTGRHSRNEGKRKEELRNHIVSQAVELVFEMLCFLNNTAHLVANVVFNPVDQELDILSPDIFAEETQQHSRNEGKRKEELRNHIVSQAVELVFEMLCFFGKSGSKTTQLIWWPTSCSTPSTKS
jgi:hypothetical protein